MAQRHLDSAGGQGDSGRPPAGTSGRAAPGGGHGLDGERPPGSADRPTGRRGGGRPAVPAPGRGGPDRATSAGGGTSGGGPAAGLLLAGDPAVLTARDVLAGYLHQQAAEFLRSLRLHRESGADAEEAVEAARQMRRSTRRICGALQSFRPLTDTEWADPLRAELAWLSGTLVREHAYAARLSRLRSALHRLSGEGAALQGEDAMRQGGASGAAGRDGRGTANVSHADVIRDATSPPDPTIPPDAAASPVAPAALTVGAARAGALLERQLTLARTRAHSAALQALGSSRFHAVADAVAVLASEVPLGARAADGPADEVLRPLVDAVHGRLVEAVDALPLCRAGHPYNADALVHGLAATGSADAPPATEQQDAPWHQVRLLVRLRRYAQEVLDAGRSEAGSRAAGGPATGSTVTGPPVTGSPAAGSRAPVPRPFAATAGTTAGAAGAGDPAGEPSLSARLFGAAQALDRHHDAAEAAAAAAAAARTPRIAPATAYALGVLHADQRHDVEAARFVFGLLWQRLAVST